jgi:hypothetical protein
MRAKRVEAIGEAETAVGALEAAGNGLRAAPIVLPWRSALIVGIDMKRSFVLVCTSLVFANLDV